MHTWTTVPGFHIGCVVYDWLHIVDLCVIPECAGSALSLVRALAAMFVLELDVNKLLSFHLVESKDVFDFTSFPTLREWLCRQQASKGLHHVQQGMQALSDQYLGVT